MAFNFQSLFTKKDESFRLINEIFRLISIGPPKTKKDEICQFLNDNNTWLQDSFFSFNLND